MSATNVQFRFLGMLIVVLTSLIARAEGNPGEFRVADCARRNDARRRRCPSTDARR